MASSVSEVGGSDEEEGVEAMIYHLANRLLDAVIAIAREMRLAMWRESAGL